MVSVWMSVKRFEEYIQKEYTVVIANCSFPESSSFYLPHAGNLHKWLFCSRGCALLYVHEDLHDEVFPLVVTRSYFSFFQERFTRNSTRDNIPYCLAPAALEFFSRLGGLVRWIIISVAMHVDV